ncbi:hypothetical protein niasHT_006001 [Heterodera trifolii]|uniref:Effector protein n=1 Tax=Heterodera trifolii TaxID=157864 RepID=A0ABD2LXD9_9BILA
MHFLFLSVFSLFLAKHCSNAIPIGADNQRDVRRSMVIDLLNANQEFDQLRSQLATAPANDLNAEDRILGNIFNKLGKFAGKIGDYLNRRKPGNGEPLQPLQDPQQKAGQGQWQPQPGQGQGQGQGEGQQYPGQGQQYPGQGQQYPGQGQQRSLLPSAADYDELLQNER